MKRFIVCAMAGLLTLFTAACGGGGGTSSSSAPSSTTSKPSPMMVTVGDAPMSSIISATVTISAASLTSGSSSVSLLTAPRTVELSSLGVVRSPLELDSVPAGTYTGVSVTVSAAQVTYLDPTTNLPTTATATIKNGTASLTLNPSLVVDGSGAGTDMHLDFDLAKSFDLTNGAVTFTPTIAAAATRVDHENEEHRHVHFNGKLTAISGTSIPATLTVQVLDGLFSAKVDVDQNTQFGSNLSLAALQVGAMLQIEGTIQPDGSVLAKQIEASDGGEDDADNNRLGGEGVVTATTLDSSKNLTSFQMVMRDSSAEDEIGKTVTVNVSSTTQFTLTDFAKSAGVTTWDQTQVFAGQAIHVSGTLTAAQTVQATEIRPAAVTTHGLLQATPTSANGVYSFVLLLDANGMFAQLSHQLTLAETTTANTEFDGDNLTSTSFATLSANSPLVTRGFVTVHANTYTMLVTHIEEQSN